MYTCIYRCNYTYMYVAKELNAPKVSMKEGGPKLCEFHTLGGSRVKILPAKLSSNCAKQHPFFFEFDNHKARQIFSMVFKASYI